MAKISADVEVLSQKGTSLAASAGQLRAELANIRVTADPTSIFEGTAATQYQTVFDSWATSQTTMLDSLEALGTWLQRAAQSMQANDEALKNSLGISA